MAWSAALVYGWSIPKLPSPLSQHNCGKGDGDRERERCLVIFFALERVWQVALSHALSSPGRVARSFADFSCAMAQNWPGWRLLGKIVTKELSTKIGSKNINNRRDFITQPSVGKRHSLHIGFQGSNKGWSQEPLISVTLGLSYCVSVLFWARPFRVHRLNDRNAHPSSFTERSCLT